MLQAKASSQGLLQGLGQRDKQMESEMAAITMEQALRSPFCAAKRACWVQLLTNSTRKAYA